MPGVPLRPALGECAQPVHRCRAVLIEHGPERVAALAGPAADSGRCRGVGEVLPGDYDARADRDKQGVEQSPAPPLKFFMMGLGGTILALAALSFLFGSRFGTRPSSETAALVQPERMGVALSATD